jgi:predicted esterase
MLRAPSRARRRVRALALLCLVLPLASLLRPPSARAGNGTAPVAEAGPLVPLARTPLPIFGAPPRAGVPPRALFVYLHGLCGLTENGCPHFDGAPGWLVCPQANVRCQGGGSAWGGSIDDKLAVVDSAVAAARTRWSDAASAPVVLVGFSQGAYVAMDAARARPGAFAGLVLLGADTANAAERLRASRVERVALACGALDIMFPKMQGTPHALVSAGVASRFESLGHVGHTYVAADGTDTVLTSLLTWVAAGREGA